MTQNLTVEDIWANETRSGLQQIQRSVTHMDFHDRDLLEFMVRCAGLRVRRRLGGCMSVWGRMSVAMYVCVQAAACVCRQLLVCRQYNNAAFFAG